MTDCTAALSKRKKWKQKIEPGIELYSFKTLTEQLKKFNVEVTEG